MSIRTSCLGSVDARTVTARGYWVLVVVVTYTVGFGPGAFFVLEIIREHGQAHAAVIVGGTMALAWLPRTALPAGYFRLRAWEQDGRLYERLGIRAFRYLAPNGDAINRLVRRMDARHRVIRNARGLAELEALTRAAEQCHLQCLTLLLPPICIAVSLGWYRVAAWLLLPNVLMHVYPMLLQRYTRGRIHALRNRRARWVCTRAPAAAPCREAATSR